MDSSRFDELTKALATATTRRQALRRIAGVLSGTVLGGLFPGLALADNSACAHFCTSVFGGDTPAQAQCASDAAHHRGLCYTCGPASPGGTQPICCPQNPDGTCSSYSSATCCSGGQVCQNGTCVTPTTTTTPPPTTTTSTTTSTTTLPPTTTTSTTSPPVCSNPTTDVCGGNGSTCGTDSSCMCVQSVEGGVYCTNCNFTCATCTADSDCGSGSICVSSSCCGSMTTACVPVSTPGTCSAGTCFSCFTAGTFVAMADGTSRPIEHILAGDLVLGNAGRVNRVIAIERPLLGQRLLYALNESNFFVTAEHPFMTEEGWKSIDPAALATEGSELPVSQLTVGDRLLTLTAAAVLVGGGRASSTEAVDVQIEAVALCSLLSRPADPATQLYNLRLDGDHTYFANDLLVHNK